MFQLPTVLQKIENDLTRKNNIHLFIKRDDLIHPEISGNKWRKLKYNFEYAKQNKLNTILTLGGAFSNHITATAKACEVLGFKSIGIIRGEEYLPLNKSLQFAKDCGMQLFYLDRENYKTKTLTAQINNEIDFNSNDIYIIPEGGANSLATKGCAEIVDEIDIDFDYIACACGTGTTLAGIANNLQAHQKAIGFPVLKNGALLYDEIRIFSTNDVHLATDYHFGGYAKSTPKLLQFIKDFYTKHNILLDYVYTGKMLYGIFDLIEKNYFPENSTIITIHTGGVMTANVFELK